MPIEVSQDWFGIYGDSHIIIFIQLLCHVWLGNTGSSVFPYLPEFAQIHVYWVSDAI